MENELEVNKLFNESMDKQTRKEAKILKLSEKLSCIKSKHPRPKDVALG